MSEARRRVAVFRPDDGRAAAASGFLESLGVDPVIDPMLAVEPTGAVARSDADVAILTSVTGVELVADAGWDSSDTRVCAIGESTASALREAGYAVDVVPEVFSSAGLVETLEGTIDGDRVEVARSDHGSSVLTDGLEKAGAYVHETILYRLIRPEGSGRSTELAARRSLDGALFTSSLTVEHFLAAAKDRGVREEAIEGLTDAVVGAIGEPTRETIEAHGIAVDVVPETADFEVLARAVVERLRDTQV